MSTERKYIVYELKKNGEIIDYGYMPKDSVADENSRGINHVFKGDGLELRILEPVEGTDEMRAKNIWSGLKSGLGEDFNG